ncbi:MAG TPA: VRR-NUC domain-containing protein [Nevskiaceae bacterium]|nr:VRR-NUC domain-containing protein [Nevskiaceae bacterium]
MRFFALVRELAHLHPEMADVFEDVWASSNGGKRPAGEAGRMRAAGQKKGVLDIECMVPRRTAHGLFIEMKSPTGRLTPEQAARIQRLRRRGYVCAVARSWEEAGRILCEYMGTPWPEDAACRVEGRLFLEQSQRRAARWSSSNAPRLGA